MLAAAFLGTKSCAETPRDVSKDQAIAIAREATTFEPDKVQVRFIRQGVPEARTFWAVSLYTLDDNGRPERIRLIKVDSRTGEILQ